MTGIKVASTAGGVSDVATSAGVLAGSAGMDVIFAGKSSRYVYKDDNKDVRLLIKAEKTRKIRSTSTVSNGSNSNPPSINSRNIN